MSQHYFSTQHHGEAITVLLGWDRPLGHYFMVVERDDPKPFQEDYLYVNLDDANAFELDLDHFRGKLRELGITVPEQMFEQVQQDQILKTGNRRVIYQPNGQFESSSI